MKLVIIHRTSNMTRCTKQPPRVLEEFTGLAGAAYRPADIT